MLRFIALLALGAMAVGCHSQVPPSPAPSVSLTWTASTSCVSGQPACTYVVSRAIVTGNSCPATTGTTYTPLNQSAPATGTNYSDASPGALNCYVAQTVQNGATSVASAASNSGVPLAVAQVPTAPGSPAATSVAMLAPSLEAPNPVGIVVSKKAAPTGLMAVASK